jgi:spermidine synthase
MVQNRKLTFLLFIFFFLSGFSALLYQIVWLKYLNLLFGSTTYATAAVLAAFFTGLFLGSRFSVRLSLLFRNPLRSYGLLEMGIGLFALSFPFLYSGFQWPFAIVFNAIGPQNLLYNIATFLLALLVLAIPTSLMGATLPLLSDYIIRDDKISQKTGLLYGLNTIGAVTGIIVGAFVLIPSLGLRGTLYVGILINLGIGLVCFLASRQSELADRPAADQPVDRPSILTYYAISGLIAIGYEVVWTRILVLHLGSSVYAYAIMLAVFLLGVSLGSLVSGKWFAPARRDLNWVFGLIQIAWAFSILVQIIQFAHLSNFLFSLISNSQQISASQQFWNLFLATLMVLFLPTFLSGALFPVVVQMLCNSGWSIKSAVAYAYSHNTAGGIVGSILTGFVFIPLFGTQKSLLLLAFVNLILGLLSTARLARATFKAALLFGLGVLFLAVSMWEQRHIKILMSAGIFQMEKNESLTHLEEDLSATISVEKRDYMGIAYDSLSINGVNVAGTSPNLVAIQKLQGHIPLILAGPDRPKKVLHIGFGSGGTAYAVSLYPRTDITVVELSRGVVRNANKYFQSVNHGIVTSGELHFIFFDGRSYLKNTREMYDVILSDSIHPRYSGNGSLYTKDYYELVYARLNPGGVHSQWIPIYSLSLKNLEEILRAFYDVFPDTYVWYVNATINPYIIVTGIKDGHGISTDHMKRALEIPAVHDDLLLIQAEREPELLDYFLCGKTRLGPLVSEVYPHSDDRLTVEYESSRVLNRSLSWRINYEALLGCREPILPYLDGTIDTNSYRNAYEATTWNLRGQDFFLLGKIPQAAQCFARAKSMNEDDPDPFEFTHLPIFTK